MKKLYPLLSVLFLIYWGCEEDQEVDTTPPTVSIQSPITNQSINEIVTIVVESNDNEGINRVEFYIDDSLFFTDLESPYQYEWNTTQYEDNSEHIVKIISYDNSDNSTTSQSIVYVIDNSTSSPNGGNITSVTYTLTEMIVEWEESTDGDFKDYKVLYSETESGNKDTIQTYTDKSTTSYTITEFNPLVENWFWVQVTDTLGLSSIGTGMTNEIDNLPTPSVLYPITYNEGFQISWSQNIDDDFLSYKLYESPSEDMSNQTLVYETTERLDTNYVVTDISDDRYYQITNEDLWGLHSISDIKVLLTQVELWGVYYSVENTTYLNIGESGLTGSIPSEIGNLTNLTHLYLHNNQLIGSIPSEIGNLTNLTDLYLNDNQLTSSITSEIGNLTNLRNLYLNDNQLTGSIPPDIGNLTNLDVLNLNDNQLTGSIPSEIGNLTNLTELVLSNNQLTGSIPLEIGNLTNLTYLTLSNNQLAGSIPPEIGNLTNMTELYLSENELTGSIPSEIGNLTNLSELRLYNNELTGSIPSEIGNLTNLSELRLYNNELTGSIPPEISNLTNLTSLNLSENRLTGSIPSEIGNLTNLTYLSLSNNQLTGFIPPEIWNLTNLTELYLSNNQLTGSIPSEIGNLTNLTELYLSNNRLTGSIPSEIGNLTNLIHLLLSNNQLTGSIPLEIGNLTNLIGLYLSENQLTGEIPESICDLNIDWSHDGYFQITYNQLCPPYPSCVEDYVGEQDTSGCD